MWQTFLPRFVAAHRDDAPDISEQNSLLVLNYAHQTGNTIDTRYRRNLSNTFCQCHGYLSTNSHPRSGQGRKMPGCVCVCEREEE